jgi:hypothetical protein
LRLAGKPCQAFNLGHRVGSLDAAKQVIFTSSLASLA